MISCRDFVLSYSEWFSIIAEAHGHDDVVRLWEAISDEFLKHLRKLVAEKGIEGMKEHWGRTLVEEDAGCKISSTEDSFTIHMHECPSVGAIRAAKHIRPYPLYCQHCDTLYRRIIEDYGFRYSIEYLDEERGVCRITVHKRDDGIETSRKETP